MKALAGLALALLASQCRRAPPRVDFESGVAPPPPVVDVPPVDVPTFAVVASAQVPGEGRTLTVGALTLTAEPAERFVASLSLPVVAGASETWVYRVGMAGEALDLLRVVAERGALRREVIAGTAPSVAGCTSASLRATSPSSVVVSARCGARVEARWVSRDAARTRSTVVVEPNAAGVADVSLDVSAEDRDHDGADELRLTLRRTDATSGPTARLVYFDRSGRLARDVVEPAQSLAESVGAALRIVGNTARALDAEGTLATLRGALCAEEGSARVVIDGARGVTCGGAGGVTDRGRIRFAAMVAIGELPAAEQVARALAAAPESASRWPEMERELRAPALLDRGWRARQGPFVGTPLDATAPGRVGSLAFDLPVRPQAVMVRGVQHGRVDFATLAFVPGESGSMRDVLATVAGAGVLVGLASRCDGVSLLLCDPAQACEPVGSSAVTTPAGLTRWSVRPGASADLASLCATNPEAMRPLGPPASQVMGVVRDRALASVEGRLWWVGASQATAVGRSQRLGAGFTPGGPVSVNGAWAVLPGLNGVWVRGATGWKLRPVEGLEGRTAQLRDLVVADDGATLAGLVGTQLCVIERRPAR